MRIVSAVSKLFQNTFQDLLIKNIKSYSTSFTTREFEEIRFSVPWGHISGKWYGPKDKRPIVGLHGWQDNAGTFDTLAPLLPQHIGFLAIDLPGHGLSSWIPDGCSYYSMDYIQILFIMMRYYNWDKISMVCHSMSAINGFIFTSLFPDKCDIFVSLDLLQPVLDLKEEDTSVKSMIQKFEAQNKQIELSLQKSNPPCYEIDELVERLHKGTGKSIWKECCQFILQRNIKPSNEKSNKYYFSRDGRLKSMTFNIPYSILVQLAHRIKCPHLCITVQKAPRYGRKQADLKEVLDALKQNPAFENHQVAGTHHVHLNEPQIIADIINPFINKYGLE